ncbi:homoserine O-acetyltransferase [Rhodococcus corynebacterioides]|uniref:Homoserine O-acetyltransferase n=1 Tax=Rhodococcoides corynebacterioides TaxID=53972 RepID=A0ABS7P043_9NOCA|nr:homoserine O-acetyltransferase [Rhodococcus corynebacterioides]MBY6406509.1 homoserine O-acetyltransferase [Rhodococcus corynebacterioides]
MGHVSVGDVVLESGAVLPDVVLAVQRWGETNADRSNVVLVEHALTGDSHVTGPAGDGHLSPGWWTGMVGPGAPLDTDRWCVVATNVLGGCAGSTGPSSPHPDGGVWGSRFPAISIRDQVAAERLFADAVGIDRFAAVVGGSMGGMRTLEWVVGHPDRVASALVLAVGARASADQIGTQTTQIAAITGDPNWHGGDYLAAGTSPDAGLAVARRIAHLTYRTEHELDTRFGNDSQVGEDALGGGRYAVASYLEHQAAKLVRRFDAGSYAVLSEAMNRHDVGRGRGGIDTALRSVRVPMVVGGVDSDRLYPLRQQQEIADLVPTCEGLRIISSRDGHDGFLTEPDAVAALLIATMTLASDAVSDRS